MACLNQRLTEWAHLGRAVEVTEWIAHCRRLRNLARTLKPIYSDPIYSDNAKSMTDTNFMDLGKHSPCPPIP
jgi:hypothetical protein